MTTTLTPKRIDPEWLNRWVRQGIELWSRAPLWLLVDILFAPAIISLSSNIIGVLLLFIIPLSAFIFVQIRLIDHYGWISLSQAWIMLKANLRDILYLTRDVFVVFFFIFILFTLVSISADNISSTNALPASLIFMAVQHAGTWETHAFLAINSWQGLICTPMAAPILFLTLLLGHHLLLHLHLAYRGLLKNWRIAVFLMIFSFLSEQILSGSVLLLKEFLGANVSLILGTFFVSFMLIVSCTFGYLWCREMFEGQTQNITYKLVIPGKKLIAVHFDSREYLYNQIRVLGSGEFYGIGSRQPKGGSRTMGRLWEAYSVEYLHTFPLYRSGAKQGGS